MFAICWGTCTVQVSWLLMEHCNWNNAIGTMQLEHCHWNSAIGTCNCETTDADPGNKTNTNKN